MRQAGDVESQWNGRELAIGFPLGVLDSVLPASKVNFDPDARREVQKRETKDSAPEGIRPAGFLSLK